MKQKFVLSIILYVIAAIANGQATTTKSGVTKGYYAIGDNYRKLASDTVSALRDSITIPQIGKGYYSIKDRNKQLATLPATRNRTTLPPVITKGYYSIGDNAKKLNKQ